VWPAVKPDVVVITPATLSNASSTHQKQPAANVAVSVRAVVSGCVAAGTANAALKPMVMAIINREDRVI